MEINSVMNERVKNWAKLQQKKYRDQTGTFLVEGDHLIAEAFRAGAVEHLLICKGHDNPFANQCEAIECSEEVIRKLSSSVSGTWIIAVCRQRNSSVESLKRAVLLDGVQDPGNVGTIIRTAVSFGFDEVILSTDCADVYNEKCVRSTQGALFHIAVKRMDLKEAIASMKEKSIPVIATALQDASGLHEIPVTDSVALILGNEGQGIREEILALADHRAFIEMFSFESLNVAVAAGICMYRYRREA